VSGRRGHTSWPGRANKKPTLHYPINISSRPGCYPSRGWEFVKQNPDMGKGVGKTINMGKGAAFRGGQGFF
jgi:hypothetical protein